MDVYLHGSVVIVAQRLRADKDSLLVLSLFEHCVHIVNSGLDWQFSTASASG